MKKFVLLILFGCFLSEGNASEIQDTLISSILTVSPGDELYSTFGHTAIRMVNRKNGYEYIFNFGTFDFDTPNFYMKFVMGRLDYMLSIESFDGFVESCKMEKRSIHEQILNFNKEQNSRLFKLLVESYKPENRYYRYKFFTDNCCTRVRDLIVKASGDDDLLRRPNVECSSTFRSLYARYMKTMPWSRFGTDILLGSFTDKNSGYDALFLPDNLKKSIDLAVVGNKHLVLTDRTLVEYNYQNNKGNIFTPIFVAILILLSTLLVQLKIKWTRIYDFVFFLFVGLIGSFVCCLTIFSEHIELHNNMVVIFFLPLNLILPFIKATAFRKYYCLIELIILIIGLILIPILPQKLNFAFILLVAGLCIRLYFNFKSKK